MTVRRKTRTFVDDFDRAQTFNATPGMNGWTGKITKTAGNPSIACISTPGGGCKLLTDNTSEAQILTVYQNDILSFPIGQNQGHYIVFDLSVAGVDAVTTIVFGLASAENDAIASLTYALLFKVLGSTSTSNVVIDTKDGTHTNSNVATGKTLGATALKFVIDLTAGLADVRFYIDGDRVAAGTTFDLSALGSTQNLQPYVQVGKASGTGVPIVTVYEYGHEFNDVLGA